MDDWMTELDAAIDALRDVLPNLSVAIDVATEALDQWMDDASPQA